MTKDNGNKPKVQSTLDINTGEIVKPKPKPITFSYRSPFNYNG